MKNQPNDGLQGGCLNKARMGRRRSAVWLALGLGLYALPADKARAQVVVTGSARWVRAATFAGYPQVDDDTADVTVDGSTNITSQASIAGALGSASVSQTFQVLPLEFSCTSSADTSGEITASSASFAGGVAESGFDVSFEVTGPVRFTITGSADVAVNRLSSGGNYGICSGSTILELADEIGNKPVSCVQYFNGAGTNSVSTNATGILLPSRQYVMRAGLQVEESDNIGVIGTQTGSAHCNYHITFDPLPAGHNQMLGALLSGGDMRFTYLGLSGTNYVLDRTFNLSPPVSWVPQATNLADVNGVLVLTNAPDQATNNFWRIRSVP
jgi:hypothetical protein